MVFKSVFLCLSSVEYTLLETAAGALVNSCQTAFQSVNAGIQLRSIY